MSVDTNPRLEDYDLTRVEGRARFVAHARKVFLDCETPEGRLKVLERTSLYARIKASDLRALWWPEVVVRQVKR